MLGGSLIFVKETAFTHMLCLRFTLRAQAEREGLLACQHTCTHTCLNSGSLRLISKYQLEILVLMSFSQHVSAFPTSYTQIETVLMCRRVFHRTR